MANGERSAREIPCACAWGRNNARSVQRTAKIWVDTATQAPTQTAVEYTGLPAVDAQIVYRECGSPVRFRLLIPLRQCGPYKANLVLCQ